MYMTNLKKTIIDSGITKQKDLKLVIQMKCNLELWCKSFAFKNKILIDLIFGVLMPLSTIFQLYHGDQF
jgi:hypothetical protein